MNDNYNIISLGSNCSPGLSLRLLNKKNETYPFDWVRSNSKIIYDVLLTNGEKYTIFNEKDKDINNQYYLKDLHSYTNPNFSKLHVNYYGQHFTHYQDINSSELESKFKNYIERFFNLLKTNKKILFIHSNEEYIYHKKSRDNKEELYNYLCKINDILETCYPNLIFKIINIDINNKFKNYGNILNYNLQYKLKFSDNCENHSQQYYNVYRNNITKIITDIIKNIKL